jgi:tetratricopeptide (TPR) repeat protein
LYFNLGVITAEQGDRAKARAYYETAIELDSTYAASYLNLAALILDGEQELVEKMNLLVNSNKRSDVINYDKMKMERKGLYLEAAPVLENLTKIDSSNVEALKTLRNIFYTLDDIVKYRIYKEKLEALGQ